MTDAEIVQVIRDYRRVIDSEARKTASGPWSGHEDDARQVIEIELWRRLKQYDPSRAKLSTWVIRVIRFSRGRFRRLQCERMVRVAARERDTLPHPVVEDVYDADPADPAAPLTPLLHDAHDILQILRPLDREFLLDVLRDGPSAVATRRGVTTQAISQRRDKLVAKLREAVL